MNSVLKRMEDIANVKMGKDTYGEMNKKTAGMSAYDKINYFSEVMSSPEFKTHTEELIKTAQEQKAKAEGKKSVEGEDGDTAIKENIKQEAVNSDSEVKADKGVGADNSVNNNADISNEGNINNNINNSESNAQDSTASLNENVNEDKSINDNADIKNKIKNKENVNNETITDKQDSFDNNEILSNEGSQNIDTDNGFSSTDKSDDNINKVSNINGNNTQLQSENISNKSKLNENVSDNNTNVNSNKVNNLTTVTYNNIINPKAKRFSNRNIADKYMRPLIQQIWPKLTLQEKESTYKYTQDSDPLNRPMRGFDKSWDNKVGIGKVSLNNEGAEQDIQNLTSAIDKSATKDDMWLYRGSDIQSLAELLKIDENKISKSNINWLNKKFKNKAIKDYAFFSTSISSDSGLKNDISYEIYAPKGTKGIYVEPFSAYGHNERNKINPSQYGANWDGNYHSGGVHTEAELILQKETEFEILEIKIALNKLTVVLKIIND